MPAARPLRGPDVDDDDLVGEVVDFVADGDADVADDEEEEDDDDEEEAEVEDFPCD